MAASAANRGAPRPRRAPVGAPRPVSARRAWSDRVAGSGAESSPCRRCRAGRPTGGRAASGGRAANSGAGRPPVWSAGAPGARDRVTGRVVLAVLVALDRRGGGRCRGRGRSDRREQVPNKRQVVGREQPGQSPARRPRGRCCVRPSDVTVSVLNGTDLQGLAARVRGQARAGVGYRKGAVTNASDQTQTSDRRRLRRRRQPARTRWPSPIRSSSGEPRCSRSIRAHQSDRLPAGAQACSPLVVRDRRQRPRHAVAPRSRHARPARPPGAELQAAEQRRHPRHRPGPVDRRDRGDDRGRPASSSTSSSSGGGTALATGNLERKLALLPRARDPRRARRDPDRAGDQPRDASTS